MQAVNVSTVAAGIDHLTVNYKRIELEIDLGSESTKSDDGHRSD